MVLFQSAQHLDGHAAVDRGIVVAIEFGDPLGERLRRFGGVLLQCGGQRRQLDPLHALVAQLLEVIAFGRAAVGRAERVEQMRVFGAVGRPAGECGFVGLLLRHRAEPLQPQQLALPFFPCVGDRSVFGGVADAGRRVGLLRRRDDSQPSCAQVDLHRVRPFDDIGHGVGRDVLLGVARKTVDHREVALADSLRGDGEVARRAVGYVFAAEFRRSVLAVGIDAEEREVARMARPHPVVGIAAELADRRGRRPDQPHVVELLVDEEELLVAVIHLLDRRAVTSLFGGLLADLFGGFARRQAVGHLFHAHQPPHPQPLVGQLFRAVARPESVGQVVVFDGRMALYGAVTAVVVGHEQSFGRDQLARAAAVEEHDGVLHRRFVDGVDVFGREAESLGAHVVDPFADQARQPHPLVGAGLRGGDCRQRRQQDRRCDSRHTTGALPAGGGVERSFHDYTIV